MQQIARIRFGRLAGFKGSMVAPLVVRAAGTDRFSIFSKVSPVIKMRAQDGRMKKRLECWERKL
jgi:hypothetical protein